VVSTPTGQASAAVDISPAAALAPDGGTQPATVAGSFPGGFAFEEARCGCGCGCGCECALQLQLALR
jgi:hypothetical protein